MAALLAFLLFCGLLFPCQSLCHRSPGIFAQIPSLISPVEVFLLEAKT